MNTQIMKRNENPEAVPGWIGGFAQSNPAFAYPDPNLSSLPVLGNLDNIPKIQRQQAIYWPEFSWLSKQGDPDQPLFPLRKGENPAYSSPDFARHVEEAWTVGNLAVQIGSIKKTGHDDVDDFNEQTMKIFNMASGNMLQSGNVLTWNLWFTAPELVDTEEWATHAERWRKSIQVEHTSPDGSVRSPARVADGSEFEAEESKVEEAHAFLKLLRSVI